MPIEIKRLPNADAEALSERLLSIQIIGTLEKPDLEILGAQLELQVEQHGKVRLLAEFVDFEGWTAGAALEDAKLAFRHFSDIERIAVVGESRWHRELTRIAGMFTSAEVRYFDVQARDQAAAWVRENGSG